MRLRFSIRDLFWLVLVVAMGLGWYLDHRKTGLQRDEFSQKAAVYEKLADLQAEIALRHKQLLELSRRFEDADKARRGGNETIDGKHVIDLQFEMEAIKVQIFELKQTLPR